MSKKKKEDWQKHKPGDVTWEEEPIDSEKIWYTKQIDNLLSALTAVVSQTGLNVGANIAYINLVDHLANMLRPKYTKTYRAAYQQLIKDATEKLARMNPSQRTNNEDKIKFNVAKERLGLLMDLLDEKNLLPDTEGFSETIW